MILMMMMMTMLMIMRMMNMMKRHVCPPVCPVHPSDSILSHPSVRFSWPSILFVRRGCGSVPSVPLASSAFLVGPSDRLVRWDHHVRPSVPSVLCVRVPSVRPFQSSRRWPFIQHGRWSVALVPYVPNITRTTHLIEVGATSYSHLIYLTNTRTLTIPVIFNYYNDSSMVKPMNWIWWTSYTSHITIKYANTPQWWYTSHSSLLRHVPRGSTLSFSSSKNVAWMLIALENRANITRDSFPPTPLKQPVRIRTSSTPTCTSLLANTALGSA